MKKIKKELTQKEVARQGGLALKALKAKTDPNYYSRIAKKGHAKRRKAEAAAKKLGLK